MISGRFVLFCGRQSDSLVGGTRSARPRLRLATQKVLAKLLRCACAAFLRPGSCLRLALLPRLISLIIGHSFR